MKIPVRYNLKETKYVRWKWMRRRFSSGSLSLRPSPKTMLELRDHHLVQAHQQSQYLMFQTVSKYY